MAEDIRYWDDQDEEKKNDSVTFSDLWGLVKDHKWTYLVCILLCGLLAGFYLYRTPATYVRSEKVIVDEDNQMSGMKDLAAFSSAYRRYASSGTIVDNEVEAFMSPDLMKQVVERLGLETSYTDIQFLRTRDLYENTPVKMALCGENPYSGFGFRIRKTGEESFVLEDFSIGPESLDDITVEGVLEDTLATPVGKICLYPTLNVNEWKNDIAVTWLNSMSRAKAYCAGMDVELANKQASVIVLSMGDVFPQRASLILTTLLDVYDEVWLQNKNRTAINTKSFIDGRLVVIQEELEAIEKTLKEYKEEHGLTDLGSISDNYLKESSEYAAMAFETENQISMARYIKEYLDDPAHETDLIPANTGISSASVEAQIKEYNTSLLQRDRLLANSSDNNPAVSELNKSILAMRAAICQSINALLASLQNQSDRIKRQERGIVNKISDASGQELTLLAIQRQQKVKEQLYIYLLQKGEENEISSLMNVSVTRRIMTPNGPDKPSSPKTKMIFLIAVFMGFVLPFGWFYVRKVTDKSVKFRSDLESLTSPFLAEIPQRTSGKGLFKKLRTNKFDESNCCTVVQAGSRDVMNEAFRVLRTNLDMMSSQKEGCHVVMVTSFAPDAGKTFTIQNMAASMAIKGAKTLLMDLDLRKGSLGEALKLQHHGVASYLGGHVADIHETVQNLSENLDFIAVGTLPPNPAELLLSDKFKKLIEGLRAEYDYIFLDCPPVDVVADTAITAKHADLTVFVIRAGMFDKRDLPQVDKLQADGRFNRVAVILNGVDNMHSSRGHYGYGYGYGYGEGSGKRRK